MLGILASGPTPGICKKKTLCNPSQSPNYKVHSKIEQINPANEPLPTYKIL